MWRQNFTACHGERPRTPYLHLLLGTNTGCSVDSRSLTLICSKMPSVGLGGHRHSPWPYEASSQVQEPVIKHLLTQINEIKPVTRAIYQKYTGNHVIGEFALIGEGFPAEVMNRQKSQGGGKINLAKGSEQKKRISGMCKSIE